MRFLLDSDTLDHYHHSRQSVLQRATAADSKNLAITIVTRIEVLHGRFESVRKAANSAELQTAQRWLDESERFLGKWLIVKFDEASCEEFDRLRAIQSPRKIGRADLLIASIALANHATLVTRNTRDFSLVPRLRIENWVN